MDNNPVQGKQERENDVSSRLDTYFDQPKPEAEEKLPEPMPSSEQNEIDEVKEPVAEGAIPEQEEELTLPENASERTKAQFEKLKARLRDAEGKKLQAPVETPAMDTTQYGQSVFDTFHPQPDVLPDQPRVNLNQFTGLNPLQAENIKREYIDQEGNVDINGLNLALERANQAAIEARRDAQRTREDMAKFEETQQAKETYAVHPELDPTKKQGFDPVYFELVRDRLLRNMYEGKKQTFLEVANNIGAFYKKPTTQTVNESQIKQAAVEQYKETQQARNQGPIESGRGEPRKTSSSYNDLRARTRREGLDSPALDERLSKYFSKK